MSDLTISERDLPRVSPAPTSHVRAVQGGKSVLIPLPEVTNAAAMVVEAIEGIKDSAQAEAELVLGGLGYLPPVAFGSGLNVDSTRFTVTYNGVTYAPVADEVPFTTTGTFDPDQWRVIQGVTAADLSLPSAAGMVGFKQVGFDAVSRTSEEKLREWVTPEDYGAVGDGGTDDTAAIQKAIAVSRVVRFRPGAVYLISSGLVVPSHTTIIAEGATIHRIGDLDNMLRNDADGVTGGYDAAAHIAVIGGTWDSLNGDGEPEGACTVFAFGHAQFIHVERARIVNDNAWHHIEFNAVAHGTVRDCSFIGGKGQALTTNEAIQVDSMVGSNVFPWFGPYDNTRCRSILVVGCRFTDVGTGVGTHTEPPSDNHQGIEVRECLFSGCYHAAISPQCWSGMRLVNNRIENVGFGIAVKPTSLRNTNDILIEGNTIYLVGNTEYAPGSGTRAIHLAGDADHYAINFRIANNTVLSVIGNGTHGIVVDFAQHGQITGNVVGDTKRSGIFCWNACNGIIVANNAVTGNNTAGAGFESIRLGTVSTGIANRLLVTGNHCTTIRAEYCSNSVITGNNVLNSLSTANNTNVTATENLVGTTWA